MFIDTTSASFPSCSRLGQNRVSSRPRTRPRSSSTIFPEYFVEAFDDPAADVDKNGRISLWEAFGYASAGVRQWYEQRGTLPTERPLLDDNGDGIGRESQTPGPDGTLARVTYLDAEAPAATAAAGGDAATDA